MSVVVGHPIINDSEVQGGGKKMMIWDDWNKLEGEKMFLFIYG